MPDSISVRAYVHALATNPVGPVVNGVRHGLGFGDALQVDAQVAQVVRTLVAGAVDTAVRTLFPTKFHGLCHVYAIVGANVATLVFGREYRPVAGLAVVDCGAGHFIRLMDNDAFSRSGGGAYHCWTESTPKIIEARELIDFSFGNNGAYARAQGSPWHKPDVPFLWGAYQDIVVDAEMDHLPASFPDGAIWLKETGEGREWMNRYLASHFDEYVKVTAYALKTLRKLAMQHLIATSARNIRSVESVSTAGVSGGVEGIETIEAALAAA